jgi:hypothetical protein
MTNSYYLLGKDSMLQKLKIIPCAFILFSFGFTLITASPVIAEKPWNPSMGMCHNSRPCIIKNACGAQCAPHVRKSKGWKNPSEYQASRVAHLNAKISGLEAKLTRLQRVVRALQKQSKKSMQPVAPTAPSRGEAAELNKKIRGLEQKNIKRYKEIQDLLRANARLWVVLSRDYLKKRDSHRH